MKLVYYAFLVTGTLALVLATLGHVADWVWDMPKDLTQDTSLIEIRGMVMLVIAYLINRDFLDE
jgi:hypothetical protein